MSRCGARASTSRAGLPVPRSRCRNTSAESTLTISKGPRSASAAAIPVLPAAVGPIRNMTGPAPWSASASRSRSLAPISPDLALTGLVRGAKLQCPRAFVLPRPRAPHAATNRIRSSPRRVGEQVAQHRLVDGDHPGAEPIPDRRIDDVAGVAIEGARLRERCECIDERRHRTGRFRPAGDGMEQSVRRDSARHAGIARSVIEPGAPRRISTPSDRSDALASSTASATTSGAACVWGINSGRDTGADARAASSSRSRTSARRPVQRSISRSAPRPSTSTWSPRRTRPGAAPDPAARGERRQRCVRGEMIADLACAGARATARVMGRIRH